jgi:hypothetical protein
LAESFLIESSTARSEVDPEPEWLLVADTWAETFCEVSFAVESIVVVVLVVESIFTLVDVESGPCFLVLSPQAANDKTVTAIKAVLTMFFIMLFLLGI